MTELLWRGLQGQLLWTLLALGGAGLLPGGSLASRLGLVRSRLGPARIGLALVGFLLLSNGLHRVIVRLALLEDSTLGAIDELVREASPSAPLLVLLAVGLAPALGEELLFRGLLLRVFALRFTGAVAVLASAVLFGAAHLDAVQGTAALFLGAYLGAVTWRAGSLVPAILCHAANNSVAVLGVQGVLPLGDGPGDPRWARPALAAAAALLALALRPRKALQPPARPADSCTGSHAEHTPGPDRRRR